METDLFFFFYFFFGGGGRSWRSGPPAPPFRGTPKVKKEGKKGVCVHVNVPHIST